MTLFVENTYASMILDASASGVIVVTGTPAQARTALELGSAALAASGDFAAAVHTHDDRYFTEAEITATLGNYLTTVSAADTYFAKTGGTLTGKVVCATAGTALGGTAAFNLPQAVGSITAYVDGDFVWGAGTGVFIRMGGTLYQFPLLNANNTFTNLCTFTSGLTGTSADIHIRNSTTAQAISIYNTYSTSTNHEHIHIGAETTFFVIASAIGSAGGTSRPIRIGHYSSGGTLTTALDVGIDGKTCITVHDQIGLSYSPAGATTATILLAAAGSNTHTVNRPTSGNITIAFSGDTNAQRWLILLTTSGSGTPGTVTWPGGITWLTNAGVAPTLATGNSKTDSIVFQRSGSSTYFAWHTGVNA